MDTSLKTFHEIRLTFQAPEHGWLPVKLELGDFVIDDLASGVLNDPIDEFLEALAFCDAPTNRSHRICLWGEPGGYAIDLLASSMHERCVIRVSSYDDFIPPMRGKEMRVEFEGETATIRVFRATSAAFGELLRPTHKRALDAWSPGQTYLTRFKSLRNARRTASSR